MKIAQINTVNYGSTGKIMLGIQKVASSDSMLEVYSYYGIGKDVELPNIFRVGSPFFNKISSKLAHVTGLMGLFSPISTIKLVRDFKKKGIQLIHMHNIHVSFLNYPILFGYIKKNDIKVVWTLHYCWSFTGHCPHFTYPNCEKWQSECRKCPRYKEYPISTFDNSKIMFRLKKKWFSGIKHLTLVTPSEWLAELVHKSFLKDYPVQVINNGIDLSVFAPNVSDFRERYNLTGKFVILGVSFDWSKKKGLDVFIELAQRLDEQIFSFVLVGVDEKTINTLPPNIIAIRKTANAFELASIYTAADVLVNPTREEVLGLVNIEANACGTPVVMFKTGGSPECITDRSGIVVEVDDIDAIERTLVKLSENSVFSVAECVAQAKKFDMNKKFRDYISLYKNLL